MKLNLKRALLQGFLTVALLAAFVFPAWAAEKVTSFKIVNEKIPLEEIFTVPAQICGVAGPFTGHLLINVFQGTEWDNGHYRVQASNSVLVFDGSGNLILRDRAAFHDVAGTKGLPESLGFNLVSQCTQRSATPGKVYDVHVVFTLGEDGTLKQIHGEFCDPGTYPFC